MFNTDLLKKIIMEQKEIFLKTDNSIKRDMLQQKEFKQICRIKEVVVITGVRRCGKSYLMRLIWQKIKKEENAAKDNVLYINFEDEKLINFKVGDFSLLIESYFELFNINKKQKIYLFLDEIQNIIGWEKFLNRLLEKGGYKIFITGSNASLLSKEVDTALTGRNYPLNLHPLSFKEFVRYKMKRDLEEKDIYRSKTRITIKKLFQEYWQNGGFPEVVLNNFRPLLQEYLKNIIYRDVVLRYHIKYESGLREITAFLTSNIGAILSLEKISKMTKIRNVMTVKNYMSYLENSFLFYLVPKYSHSIKKQIYNPDKIYIVDTGMYNEIAFVNAPNEGQILENLVLLELKRRNKNVYYYQKERECDFIIQQKNKIREAIQVTKFLSKENEEREVDGLMSAMNEYGLKEGLILTVDENDEKKINNKIIKIKPIWEWLLI